MKNKNIKYTTAKRAAHKGKVAPKGFTHLIVKVKSKRTGRVYEAWQMVPTQLTKDNEITLRNNLVANIFDQYKDVKEEAIKEEPIKEEPIKERDNWLVRLLKFLQILK